MEVLEVQEEMLQDVAVGVDRLYRQVGSSALSDLTRPSVLSLLALSLDNRLSHPRPPIPVSY
jgi:hypothetical protein